MKSLNQILIEQISNISENKNEYDQSFSNQIFNKDNQLIEQKYDFIKKYVLMEQTEDETDIPDEETNPQTQQEPISPQTGKPMLTNPEDTDNITDPNMDPNNIQGQPGIDDGQQNMPGMGQDISDEPVETDIPEPKDFIQYIKLYNQIEFLENSKDLYAKYGTTDNHNDYIERINKLLEGLKILSNNINKYTKEEIFNISDEVDKFINTISKKQKGEK